jgi:hypothetical protein
MATFVLFERVGKYDIQGYSSHESLLEVHVSKGALLMQY